MFMRIGNVFLVLWRPQLFGSSDDSVVTSALAFQYIDSEPSTLLGNQFSIGTSGICCSHALIVFRTFGTFCFLQNNYQKRISWKYSWVSSGKVSSVFCPNYCIPGQPCRCDNIDIFRISVSNYYYRLFEILPGTFVYALRVMCTATLV